MKRIWLGCITLVGIGAAVVFSGGREGVGKTFFPTEERNPVTHLRWNDSPDDFQFAVVSDRTGGHRAEVFSQAVDKLNLLQPEFVLSVGDFIEGGKISADKIAAEWKEFDGFIKKFNMPFFYVPGNHDVATKETTKAWQDKLGRRHYHFVYRGVLFLILNTDDPPEKGGAISEEQIAYVQKTLKDNASARWTIVALHRPLWTKDNGAANGFAEVEKALAGRPYTVFCGHEHNYEKFVRNGMNYYQLATTGGASLMRGVEFGEFDHIVWVTMKKDGPLMANIMLDSIQAENLKTVKIDEPGFAIKKAPTYPVRGQAYFEGVPMAGAVITLIDVKDKAAKPTKTLGIVEADGTFRLSTYQAFDGAPAGDYLVGVAWREANGSRANLLPAKYASPATSGLRATVTMAPNDLVFELKK